MTAIAVTVPRMVRATWFKHRTAMLATILVFAVPAVALVINSAVQRHYLGVHHLTWCLRIDSTGTGGSACTSPAWTGFAGVYDSSTVIAILLLVLAPAVGLFAGLPWVAREFEGGGFRFTWTQSISSHRWLLGTFGPLTAVAVVAAALCGAAAYWWHQVAQWQSGIGDSPWKWTAFELTPLAMLSWTVLAMALAMLLGVMIRRLIPAMAAFVVIAGILRWLAAAWLRPHLLSIGQIVRQVPYSYAGSSLGRSSVLLQDWFTTPSGARLSLDTVYLRMGNLQGDPSTWLAQHHLSYWMAYQTHDRLIWFQLAWPAIVLAAAIPLVLAAIWWLRRRPAG